MRKFVCAALLLLAAAPLVCAKETPIVFAAYNVQNWLLMDRKSRSHTEYSAPKPDTSKAAVVESLISIHPDIIGIEEIGDLTQLEDLRKRLKDAGSDYSYLELVSASDPVRHVALLSKFPIVEKNSLSNISFPLNGRNEHMERGILDVTLRINDLYRLRVLGVHLKSKRNVSGEDEARMRDNEAYELRKHIDAILTADPKTNLLVFGDMNDTKNTTPIQKIIGIRGSWNYMEDLPLADPAGERWTYYWSWADEYSRIDYLLVSSGLKPEILWKKSGISRLPQWYTASDHRPVYTAIFPRDLQKKIHE